MIQKSVILNFPRSQVDKPVVSSVIRSFDVEVNILQAHVTPEEAGRMFTIFKGERHQVDRALDFLRQNEVQTILPVKNLVWDEELCVHCGACVGQCLSSAFNTETESRRTVFDAQKC
ncbi:MAG: 4Fe-4S binding protein, partial [Deltaproteobacteria bacterium]|nr:4Fe-4S binding protein [Deltaproteobacteria bacterium]